MKMKVLMPYLILNAQTLKVPVTKVRKSIYLTPPVTVYLFSLLSWVLFIISNILSGRRILQELLAESPFDIISSELKGDDK